VICRVGEALVASARGARDLAGGPGGRNDAARAEVGPWVAGRAVPRLARAGIVSPARSVHHPSAGANKPADRLSKLLVTTVERDDVLLSRPAAGVDPELLALPAPARGRRFATLTLMAACAAAALAMLASLRADVAYFFADDRAQVVGEAVELDPRALSPNTYVTLEGTPMASTRVTYERVLGDRFAVFPLAGQRRVLVQVPADDGFESRASARREFSGRLVTVGQLGSRFGAVERTFERMDVPVSSETYVLLADEPPGSYVWALLLAALCALVVVLDVFLLLRWFRPIRLESTEALR